MNKEYAIKIAKEMGKRFSPVKLKNILDFGGDLDYKIKSGDISAENALFYFITNITMWFLILCTSTMHSTMHNFVLSWDGAMRKGVD